MGGQNPAHFTDYISKTLYIAILSGKLLAKIFCNILFDT